MTATKSGQNRLLLRPTMAMLIAGWNGCGRNAMCAAM
jgi:hypothetical protein